MKKLAIIVACILCISGCVVVMTNQPPPSPNARYTVTIGNWVGQRGYKCHHYERDGNTWILYYQNGTVAAELTASPGYTIQARLSP